MPGETQNVGDHPPTAPEVVPVTAAQLKQRLDQGESLTLLDVREPKERALCALPRTATASDLHVPMREVPDRLGEIRQAAGSAPLVVYCHHGVRSLAVGRWLAGQGLAGVQNLEGGIDAWSIEVDPNLPRY